MARYGLARHERVRKTREYKEILERGRRVHSRWFYLVFLPRDDGRLRLGLLVGRKVGKAAARNWVKRRVREFFRLNKYNIRQEFGMSQNPGEGRGMDLLFGAKPGAADLSSAEADRELWRLVKKAAALAGQETPRKKRQEAERQKPQPEKGRGG